MNIALNNPITGFIERAKENWKKISDFFAVLRKIEYRQVVFVFFRDLPATVESNSQQENKTFFLSVLLLLVSFLPYFELPIVEYDIRTLSLVLMFFAFMSACYTKMTDGKGMKILVGLFVLALLEPSFTRQFTQYSFWLWVGYVEWCLIFSPFAHEVYAHYSPLPSNSGSQNQDVKPDAKKNQDEEPKSSEEDKGKEPGAFDLIDGESDSDDSDGGDLEEDLDESEDVDETLMPEVEALEIIKHSSGWSGDLQKMKEKWVAAACEEHKVDAEWLIPRIGSWLKETGKTGHFTKITGEFLKSQKPS